MVLNTKNFVLVLIACIEIVKANGVVLLGVLGGAISSGTRKKKLFFDLR